MKRVMKDLFGPLSAMVLTAAMATVNMPYSAWAASPGSLDPTFGTAGRLTTNMVELDVVEGVAVQPDGKIIVLGRVDSNGVNPNFGLIRYNPNGTIDTRFGDNGIVITDFGENEEAGAIAIEADGKIVAVGNSRVTGSQRILAISRYLPNGARDTTFNADGRFTFDVPGNSDSLSAVAIQADGKIVAGGSNASKFLVVRLTPDGLLDTTFNTDGIVTSDLGGTQFITDIAVQTDGKIVVVGEAGLKFAIAGTSPPGRLIRRLIPTDLRSPSWVRTATLGGHWLYNQTENMSSAVLPRSTQVS